jgi:hypothetical protein
MFEAVCGDRSGLVRRESRRAGNSESGTEQKKQTKTKTGFFEFSTSG